MSELRRAKVRKVILKFETWISVPVDYEFTLDDDIAFYNLADSRMAEDEGEWDIWTEDAGYGDVSAFDLTPEIIEQLKAIEDFLLGDLQIEDESSLNFSANECYYHGVTIEPKVLEAPLAIALSYRFGDDAVTKRDGRIYLESYFVPHFKRYKDELPDLMRNFILGKGVGNDD